MRIIAIAESKISSFLNSGVIMLQAQRCAAPFLELRYIKYFS